MRSENVSAKLHASDIIYPVSPSPHNDHAACNDAVRVEKNSADRGRNYES